jgi:DNA-binding transcriptional MocR family regulator
MTVQQLSDIRKAEPITPMTKQQMRNGRRLVIGRAELESLATSGGPSSLVDQIFMLVAGAIQTRQLAPGDRLPSIRQLADDCRISRDTTARAYDKLVAHGVIESRRGSGFYAKKAAQQRRVADKFSAQDAVFTPDTLTWWRMSLVRPDAALLSRTGTGALPEDWIDEAGIAGALRAVARGSQRSLAQHGDPQGYLPLRQQLQLKLQDMGVQTEARHIIVTSGATDALNLIAQSYLRNPEQRVLLEQPCAPLLADRLLSCGMDFAFVPRQDDGPDIDVLRALCKEHRPRFFFCNSVLHNPTSSHLAPHKAFQILRLAEEFDLTIVEDDTYGDLMPHGAATPIARLAPLDQLQRVIYVGSFSKTLAPGLRTGYLAANPARIEWMRTYRAVSCIAGNSLAERTVYRLLSQGTYRHHCEQLRARLADARPIVADALRSAGMQLDSDSGAGMYLWARFSNGIDTMSIAQRLLEQGHLVAPGRLFSGSGAHHACMRFNVAATLNSPVIGAIQKLLGSATPRGKRAERSPPGAAEAADLP